MQLSEIFIVKNHQGLFKSVEHISTGLVVESLIDGKRLPFADKSDDVFCLQEIELCGIDRNISLSGVFKNMLARDTEPDYLLKSDVKVVKDYFRVAVPEMDQSRVFSSDMRRIVGWFSVLKDKVDFNDEIMLENNSL